ncbi:16S rRNA (uracil(1498)-N(3))-methyltransferase [Solihabitans fulvus]|uniref:Ribosomal RNA small subunit methyltransferase E n=1 Tax=Solihabitans fulvus TaxID=1892852 RepID=A0A5B2XRP0_9PSEU|nr:16S rRNA (uracil(1498)-N(3))-methyltransferase [Solihabitans fulvus]KAA2266073.1 16S rRNA (uracil(1498)-N(3))-methyltransferase [Solihabitans fulvus]
MPTTPPVFLVDALPPGQEALLDGPEGRHAAAVRRLRAGEELVLADGVGGLAACTVREAAKDSLLLTVTRRWTDPPPTPRVVVAQALIKGDRGELAVELATEAGADEIVPWRASRCVAKWEDGPRGDKALAKWRATAREAAKQARRAWVPPVHEPLHTKALAARATEAALTLVLHESATRRLSSTDLPPTGDVLLVVGPEGGITEEELAALTQAGAHPVRLGPTVLRASTAAAVALGALGALTNRWS